VHASNSARLEEAFSDIAERVGLPSRLGMVVDNLQLVRKWLCNEANGRWLMIVDNVDHEFKVEVQDGQSISLASLLPQSDHGAILITSRNTDIARGLVGREQDLITVDTMSEGEAVKLLEKKLGDAPGDGTTQLALALEYIPLAIVQAAAYINRLGPRMSAAKYLNEFENLNKRTQLLYKAAEDMRRDRQALNSVLTTWQISFEYIREKRPSAADMLSYISFFNRQAIPEFMIRHYADVERRMKDDSLDIPLKQKEFDFEEDMAVLRAFSLVSVTQREDEFEMHGLVQFATRLWLGTIHIEERWRQRFIQAMAEEFPNGEFVNWSKCRTLFPHVFTLVEQEQWEGTLSKDLALLLNNAGWYAWQQGLFVQAEDMVAKALKFRQEASGANDSSTLLSASLRGSILSYMGKYEEAEAIHRQTLVEYEKVLGREHPNTLTSMNNLALVLDSQGKYEAAEAMHRQTLATNEKVLGKEHPNTLASMNNLALVLGSQGKYEAAEAMHRQTLAIREKVLGKEHPNTLASMNNLAEVLNRQGKYEAAEAMHRQTLATCEKVLGKEHPNTLASMNNLALVLDSQGKYEAAEAMHRQTLATKEKVLGKEHPDTLTSMNNLAFTWKSQGRNQQAVGLMSKCLQLRQQILGTDHPDTISSLQTLTNWQSNTGKDLGHGHEGPTPPSILKEIPSSSKRQRLLRKLGIR
jgi:Flp pilus assembly protein TadD